MKLPSTLFLAACTVWGTASLSPSAQAQPHASSSLSVTTSRGRLGAQVITISESLRRHFAAPATAGLLVDRVLPGSPAAKAGLATGDVIVDVHGSAISEAWDIYKALRSSKKGDKINVKVIRNRKPRTLQVLLDDDASGSSMINPFGGQGTPFGKNRWPPESMLRGDKSFPFGPMQQGSQDTLREKVRKLEQRIDKLEGRKSTSKPTTRTKKSPKQIKGTAWRTGKRS